MKKRNKIRISVSIENKDLEKVDALAATEEVNRSEMIRLLIRSKRKLKNS